MKKLILFIEIIICYSSIIAQNHSLQDFSEQDFLNKEMVLKYKIARVKVSNTCHSNLYNIHSGKYECENMTNTHEYYFNKLGLLDSFVIRDKDGVALFHKFKNYDEKQRLINTTDINNREILDKKQVFYSYDDSNRKTAEYTLFERDGYDTSRDTTQYLWKGDTCISFQLMNRLNLQSAYKIYNDREDVISWGRYSLEKQKMISIDGKIEYRSNRKYHVVSPHPWDDEPDIEDTYYYETDNLGRVVKINEQLNSGKSFYSTTFFYKDGKVSKMVYKNELFDDSYISMVEYFK